MGFHGAERAADAALARVGVVVIGRNEGERLRRCFDAIPVGVPHVVYVDSGSTDGSVEEARRRGIDVVSLDLSVPFTAARARNAGFERLRQLAPEVEAVQFIDGDCELRPEWIPRAFDAMAGDDGVAAVCGRLLERFRGATVYNRLCDLEWDGPAGEVDACGGIALMRVAALREVGGFDASLIAGEEPELCYRLRRRGRRIVRIAAEMALHDAAMTRFGQWWRRAIRGGHAYAEIGALHPELWRRERRSIVLWGLALPVAAVIAAAATGGAGIALLAAYPAQALRVLVRRRASGVSLGDAALYGAFCVVGKFPELAGMARYWRNRGIGRRTALIEYK